MQVVRVPACRCEGTCMCEGAREGASTYLPRGCTCMLGSRGRYQMMKDACREMGKLTR